MIMLWESEWGSGTPKLDDGGGEQRKEKGVVGPTDGRRGTDDQRNESYEEQRTARDS